MDLELKDIADLFELSERRIQQLAKEAIIVKAEHGKYDLVESVRGYIAFIKENRGGTVEQMGERALARHELVLEQTRKLQLENDEKAAKLIEVEAVREFVTQFFNLYRGLLSTLHREFPLKQQNDVRAIAERFMLESQSRYTAWANSITAGDGIPDDTED